MHKLEKNSKYLFLLSLLAYLPLLAWNTIRVIKVMEEEIALDSTDEISIDGLRNISGAFSVLGALILILLAYLIFRFIFKKINSENEQMIARFNSIFFLNMSVLNLAKIIVLLLSIFILNDLEMTILPISIVIKALLLLGLNTVLIEGEENRPVANTVALTFLALF